MPLTWIMIWMRQLRSAMNNTDDLTKEPRTVLGLSMPNNDTFHVGNDGIAAIQPIDVTGQMAYVPWFNVWRGKTLVYKVNAAHVAVVLYAPNGWLGPFKRNQKRATAAPVPVAWLNAAFLFGGRTQMERVNVTEEVKSLVSKAEKAEKSDDALKFSQAACNAANAACATNAANGMIHPSNG
jgi:hypothetical protein